MFHYTRNFRRGQPLIVEDELIACDADIAPEQYYRTNEDVSDGQIKETDFQIKAKTTEEGLSRVCTLRTDLGSVPPRLFERFVTSQGVEFDNLDFELHMKIESADLVFELMVDGIRYGSVEAEFH